MLQRQGNQMEGLAHCDDSTKKLDTEMEKKKLKAEVGSLKQQINTLKIEHKEETFQMKKEIMRLKQENEKLILQNVHANEVKDLEHKANLEKVEMQKGCKENIATMEKTNQQHFVTKSAHLKWGVEKYFEGIPPQLRLYDSYEAWYLALSRSVLRQVSSSRHLFLRRNLSNPYEVLKLHSVRRNQLKWTEEKNTITFTGMDLTNGLWCFDQVASLLLLHPKCAAKCKEFTTATNNENWQEWSIGEITEDFYGEDNGIIILGIK